MNTELREAVREYVDKLLAARGQSHDKLGDVTPEELLVAARAAGVRASRNEAASLAAKDGVFVVSKAQPQTNAGDVRSHSAPAHMLPGGLPSKAPALCKEAPAPRVMHRKDYHWSVWKTTPTPQPMTPRPPSARPATAVTVRSLAPTPDGLRSPAFRPEQVLDYPGGMRTPTPEGRVGAPTPNDMKPDHRDVLTAAQTAPKDLALQKLRESQVEDNQTLFVPALKAWVNNANDYERDIAYNLIQSISGPNNTLRDSFWTGGHRRPGSPVRARPRTAGIRTKPMHLSAPHIEQKYINILGKSMERQAPVPLIDLPLNGSSLRPMARHAETQRPLGKDYTHEASMFMNARLPYKSSFVVHPEWISENPSLKRNLSQMKTTTGPKGFRYASK